MTWLFFAFLCAFGEALKDITSKKGLQKLQPLTISWIFFGTTTVLCVPLLYFETTPSIGPHYWWALIAHSSLYGSSVYLYMRAISVSDLSLTVPITMFTPIFMLITTPIMLDEWPSELGLLGTVLIVLGSYLLNISKVSDGALAPIKALVREPGARLMLFVTFIWSLTSPIDKIGIQNSSPIFWGVSVFALATLVLSVLVLRRGPAELSVVRSQWRIVLAVGFFNTIQTIGYLFGMQLGLAVYVLAIKRTSVFLVILIGALYFNEANLKERLFGVLIMIIGVFCIAFQ